MSKPSDVFEFSNGKLVGDTLNLPNGFVNLTSTGESQQKITYTRQLNSSPPLYFVETGDRLWLSHDIISLRRVSNTNKLNHRWLARYFSFQENFSDETPFLNIKSLPVNTALEISDSGVRTYSSRKEVVDTNNWRQADWVSSWQAALSNSVASSCSTQQPVAIMLSSGIDSSGIAAYLVKKNIQVKAFSWRFPNHPSADESHYISGLAKHLGIDVEFIDITDAQCFDDLNTWQVAPDAPYFNAMRRIKAKLYERVAASGCRVLLNGHMGDELAFVDRYYFAELWKDKPLKCSQELLKLFLSKGIKVKNDSAVRYWVKQRLRLKEKVMPAPSYLSAYSRKLIGEEKALPNNGYRTEQYAMLLANSELDAIATESFFTSPYSFERKHPYLNQQLIDLALACPAYILSTPKQPKYLARKVLEGMLPDEFLQRDRVGQLDVLFENGLEKNQKHIRDFLFRANRTWPNFVQESAVNDVFDNQRWDKAAAILVPCIGLERWFDYWRELDLPVEIEHNG